MTFSPELPPRHFVRCCLDLVAVFGRRGVRIGPTLLLHVLFALMFRRGELLLLLEPAALKRIKPAAVSTDCIAGKLGGHTRR